MGHLCGLLSNEEAFGCGTDFGGGVGCPNDFACSRAAASEPCRCGVYQIDADYFAACSQPPYTLPKVKVSGVLKDATLVPCSTNVKCATACVRNYIHLHARKCTGVTDPAQLTCQQRVIIHKAGANCKKNNAVAKAAKRAAKTVTGLCNMGVGECAPRSTTSHWLHP